MNLSKRGIGLSAGPRGASLSIGRSGIFSHTGLPGTGLSFRRKINKKASGRNPARQVYSNSELENSLHSGAGLPIRLVIGDSGEICFQNDAGIPYSKEEIRVIKRHAGKQLREKLTVLIDELNADIHQLGEIHLETPAPQDIPVFISREFPIPKPEREPAAEKGLLCKIWPPAARKVDAINQARTHNYIKEHRAWSSQREAFELAESERKVRETVCVKNDLDAMGLVLEEYLGLIPWPRETEIDFDLGDDSQTIAIDINLPTEDQFPAYEWSMPAKQIKISKKNLTITRRRKLYMNYVHGVAMRVLGEVFSRLPTIETAMVSAYTQAVDPATGLDIDMYLYSVIVSKRDWKRINFQALHKIDPAEALSRFQLKRRMTKTGIFKGIDPLTLTELEASAADS